MGVRMVGGGGGGGGGRTEVQGVEGDVGALGVGAAVVGVEDDFGGHVVTDIGSANVFDGRMKVYRRAVAIGGGCAVAGAVGRHVRLASLAFSKWIGGVIWSMLDGNGRIQYLLFRQRPGNGSSLELI